MSNWIFPILPLEICYALIVIGLSLWLWAMLDAITIDDVKLRDILKKKVCRR